MAKAGEGRRRFAPIPIETTFEQRRQTGPAAELTPSPSPRSPPPPPRDKRRFAPQLVESSIRRSRRAGDIGPATKPTDRTDITPYTKHIYAPKSRRRYGNSSRPDEKRASHGRRESCDDEISGGVFDLVAKDAQRKLQEIALTGFPNSGIRIGGAEHFYVREGSGSDDGLPRGRPLVRTPGPRRPSRRDSSEEEVGWALKEMQDHAEQLGKLRGDTRVSSIDLDKLELDSPPADPLWTTQNRTSLSGSLSGSMTGSIGPVGEQHMPLIGEERLTPIGETTMPYVPPQTRSPPMRPIGETFMPYIPTAPPGKAGIMPYATASQIPPETGFGNRGGFSRPFGGFRHDRDLDREHVVHRMRTTQSPPLLGKDLSFRKCLSPKQTKLEPDHLWDLETGTTMGDPNRDETEAHGLWHGYCWTDNSREAIAKVDRPMMISTPHPAGYSTDPFAAAFGGAAAAPASLSEEPTPLDTHAAATRAGTLSTSEHRARNNAQPKGVHMLQGLDERLRKEKAAADREEKIVAEFDAAFVTQVYNYLSLGYPAMARAYDDELSKISSIGVDTLREDDDGIMDRVGGGKARGYILTEARQERDTDDADSADGGGGAGGGGGDDEANGAAGKGPRWRALRLYIREWARQHPNLDSVSPPTWGVMERRGSWGI